MILLVFLFILTARAIISSLLSAAWLPLEGSPRTKAALVFDVCIMACCWLVCCCCCCCWLREGGSLFFVHFCHRAAAVEAAVGEFLLVGRFQNLKTAHQGLVHRHHGTWKVRKLALVLKTVQKKDRTFSRIAPLRGEGTFGSWNWVEIKSFQQLKEGQVSLLCNNSQQYCQKSTTLGRSV